MATFVRSVDYCILRSMNTLEHSSAQFLKKKISMLRSTVILCPLPPELNPRKATQVHVTQPHPSYKLLIFDADQSQSSFAQRLARKSTSSSPVKVAGSSHSVKSALAYDDPSESLRYSFIIVLVYIVYDTLLLSVPVYDGRNGSFSMTKLDKLHDTLEPWTGELKD